MKFPSLFKTVTPRQFNFKPRYYNAEKEAFEKRVREITARAAGATTESEQIRERIHHRFQMKRKTKSMSVSGNLRIVGIIMVLSLLFFWLLK